MEPIDLLLFMVTVSETESRGERESGWVGCATTAIVPSAIAITVMVLIESTIATTRETFPSLLWWLIAVAAGARTAI